MLGEKRGLAIYVAAKRREEIVRFFDVERNWARVRTYIYIFIYLYINGAVCVGARTAAIYRTPQHPKRGWRFSSVPGPGSLIKRFNRLQTFTWPTGFFVTRDICMAKRSPPPVLSV